MSNKPENELNDIIEGFKIFSSDNEGIVNPNELKEIMEIMNYNEKNPFIYNIIKQLCSEPNIQQKGGIEAGDFISILDQHLDDISSNEGLQQIFTSLYNPSTSAISLENISENIDNDDDYKKVKKLISRIEIKNKEINFNEFRNIMKIDLDKDNSRSQSIPRRFSQEKIYKKKTSIEGIKSYHSHSSNKKIKYSNNKRNNNDEDDVNKFDRNYNNDNFENENIYYKEVEEVTKEEGEEEEEINIKKKYRHMRKKQNKNLVEEKEKSDLDENEINFEEKNEKNVPYRANRYTKGRISNNNIKEEFIEKNNINDKNIDDNNNQNNNEIKGYKRYHRRYRDNKSYTPDKKTDKTNEIKNESYNKDNDNIRYVTGNSRYYRKNY